MNIDNTNHLHRYVHTSNTYSLDDFEVHYYTIAVAMGILMITVFPIICLLDEELIVCQ